MYSSASMAAARGIQLTLTMRDTWDWSGVNCLPLQGDHRVEGIVPVGTGPPCCPLFGQGSYGAHSRGMAMEQLSRYGRLCETLLWLTIDWLLPPFLSIVRPYGVTSILWQMEKINRGVGEIEEPDFSGF
ncbi:hypothetical protein [Nitrosospira briensis]|uniref:hypothetical protein n=1 Tax=Nitrosospira briensis TaxID=35799 RepID=UPI0011604F67|nr:hypothetical protein [Nitrosospira briensis]